MIHSSFGGSCSGGGERRLAGEGSPVGLFYYSLARLKLHRLQGQDSEVDRTKSRQLVNYLNSRIQGFFLPLLVKVDNLSSRRFRLS
jgi:hypothetical protein